MSLMRKNALGIYISIPFCRSKCTYCNFASGVYPAGEHERYVARLIQDMSRARQWAADMDVDLPRTVDSVYLGGGTPSLLAPELIRNLFINLRHHFLLDPEAEITMECAPGQLADPTLDAMAEVGVNRVSLGVQSFIDHEAQASGRLHGRATVLQDLRRLRDAGMQNLNIDLITGLAGQTFDSWNESLSVLLDSGVPHASIYMLEVDEDSRLGRELLSGGARYKAGLVPSDDAITLMYEDGVERLTGAGLAQYEISNFARSGHQSRHNLRYWERRPYLGIGLDASSMAFETDRSEQPYVLRWKTTDDLMAYLKGTEPAETAWLSPDRQHEEAWFLGLRLNSGVSAEALLEEFGSRRVNPALEIVKRHIQDGLLARTGGTISLTPLGRLLSNEVFQEFLGVTEPESSVSRH